MASMTIAELISALQRSGWQLDKGQSKQDSRVRLYRKGSRVVAITGEREDKVGSRAASGILQLAEDADK